MTHRPVLEMIQERVPYSLALSLVSITLAYLIALPIGIYSASRPGTLADSVTTLFLFLLYSLPSFFTGTVLLLLLSTGEHRIFPSGGFFSPDLSGATALGTLRDAGWHLVLPVATYTSGVLASLSRYARSGIVDVIRADYVRTARAKGLSEVVVVVKHAARNGMIPILTLLGGLLPALVGGSVIIESVFNIPGMGLYLYQSISNYDYNAVMGVLLISSLLTLFGIFLSDLSYALVDPRISYE
jgi:peptide/nickel transport system permease protein